MVHSYNKRIFDTLIGAVKQTSYPMMANTLVLFNSIISSPQERSHLSEIVYGIETRRSSAAFFLRNIDLMSTISQNFNIRFLSILQPVGPTGRQTGDNWSVTERYANLIVTTFEEIQASMDNRTHMIDFSRVLDNTDGVYLDDGVHLTTKGNTIIAEQVLKRLHTQD